MKRQPLKKCAFLVFLGLREVRELLLLNGGNLGVFEAHGAAAKINWKSSSEHPLVWFFREELGGCALIRP